MDLLKAENDRLKVAPGPSSGPAPGQAPGPAALPSPRRSLGLVLAHSSSPSLTDTGNRRGDRRAGSGPRPHIPCALVAFSLAREVTVPKPSRCRCHRTVSLWSWTLAIFPFGATSLLRGKSRMERTVVGSLGVPVGAPKAQSPSLPADLSPMDGISTCGPKEEATLRVVVRMSPQRVIRGVRTPVALTQDTPP